MWTSFHMTIELKKKIRKRQGPEVVTSSAGIVCLLLTIIKIKMYCLVR